LALEFGVLFGSLRGGGFGLIRVYFRVQVRFGSGKKPGFWFGSFLLGSGSFPSLVKMENFGLAKDGAKVGPFPDLELATGKARATDSEAVYRRLARCTELDGAGNSSQSTPVPAKILSRKILLLLPSLPVRVNPRMINMHRR